MAKKGSHIAAGLAGVAVGATVGAAAVAMVDKKNRKKVLKAAQTFTTQTMEVTKNLKDRAVKLQSSLKKTKRSLPRRGNGVGRRIAKSSSRIASAM